MELKSIGVLSCGKLMGVMYALIGVIVGGFMAFISLLGVAGGAQMQNGANQLLVFGAGLGALLFLPILYGIMGFIGGIVGAFIYNLVAEYTGGIELNFQQQQDFQ